MRSAPTYPASAGWRDRIHPDDWPRVQAAQRDHLEGRSARFEETYRMRHADGHWVWVFDRGQVLERDGQGAPLRVVGTHMDVTEATERQLANASWARSMAASVSSRLVEGTSAIACSETGLMTVWVDTPHILSKERNSSQSVTAASNAASSTSAMLV